LWKRATGGLAARSSGPIRCAPQNNRARPYGGRGRTRRRFGP